MSIGPTISVPSRLSEAPWGEGLFRKCMPRATSRRPWWRLAPSLPRPSVCRPAPSRFTIRSAGALPIHVIGDAHPGPADASRADCRAACLQSSRDSWHFRGAERRQRIWWCYGLRQQVRFTVRPCVTVYNRECSILCEHETVHDRRVRRLGWSLYQPRSDNPALPKRIRFLPGGVSHPSVGGPHVRWSANAAQLRRCRQAL